MVIKNKTNGITLVSQSRHCLSVHEKAIGLMFSRKIIDKGLIFHFNIEKKVSLHMIFVFYSIDVLFLDKQQQVCEMKEEFKPFTFFYPKKKSKFVIELPSGTIKKSKTKIGHKILFD